MQVREVKAMHDAGKVITGMIVFFVLATSPFWLNAGSTSELPKLEKAVKAKKCVEPVEVMRANHMQMLDDWRHEVVREGERTYTNEAGKEFKKSLTLTCLDCHENKKKFCDKCHQYAGVKPFCWECHVDPKEKI
jgi:cytochrome c